MIVDKKSCEDSSPSKKVEKRMRFDHERILLIRGQHIAVKFEDVIKHLMAMMMRDLV